MGFGVLFFGYFIYFLLQMNPYGYGWILLPFGCLLIVRAVNSLAQYFAKMKYLFISLIPMFLLSLYRLFYGLNTLCGWNIVFAGEVVLHWVAFAERLFLLAFHLIFARAVFEIATDLELPRIRVASVRNFIFVGIYFILYTVAEFPTALTTYLTVLAKIVQIIWIILNVIMIYSCYMNICPEGEEDGESAPKRSRFKFLNNIRDKFTKK